MAPPSTADSVSVKNSELDKKSLKGGVDLKTVGGTKIEINSKREANEVIKSGSSPIATVRLVPQSAFGLQVRGIDMDPYWELYRRLRGGGYI